MRVRCAAAKTASCDGSMHTRRDGERDVSRAGTERGTRCGGAGTGAEHAPRDQRKPDQGWDGGRAD
eukprot:289255-Rhodomonas_salina.2